MNAEFWWGTSSKADGWKTRIGKADLVHCITIVLRALTTQCSVTRGVVSLLIIDFVYKHYLPSNESCSRSSSQLLIIFLWLISCSVLDCSSISKGEWSAKGVGGRLSCGGKAYRPSYGNRKYNKTSHKTYKFWALKWICTHQRNNSVNY